MSPAKVESLGIIRLEAIHYYVRDLARSRRFYTEKLDFAEVGRSTAELERGGKQTSAIFDAAGCRVVVSEPRGEGGRAWRWLRRHPDGVGSLVFEVRDIARTFSLIEARRGTPIDEVQSFDDGAGGTLRTFSMTTPLGSSTFRFVQRDRYDGLYPGIARLLEPRGGKNLLGFERFDHVTSNFETMRPAVLWMEHVCGFERDESVEAHPSDGRADGERGASVRSTVMRDPASAMKFTNNEPQRPFFKDSQINVFHEEQRGDGIQHAALAVRDLVAAVRAMRSREVAFTCAPPGYYDALPARLETLGVSARGEDLEALRDLQILVDGSEAREYLLQVFLRDSAELYGDKDAGPFFYELIQRKPGDATIRG